MSFTPDPLHTGHVQLPPELMELKEILAANVHDLWARQRIAEGWVFGPHRDDQARTHPCLVPYEQLPQSERHYDRETAVETLRVVLAHGYRILPPSQTGSLVARSSQVERELVGLRHLLEAADVSDMRSLVTRWRTLAPDSRWSDLELARTFVERLLEYNEPLLAYDFAVEGLERWPSDTRLLQLKGIGLARSGAARQASKIFQQLRDAGHRDEETLANLARTYKTLWSEARDAAERQTYLDAAYHAYRVAFTQSEGYWSGINVAFLALLRGDHEQARATAAQVHHQCLQQLDTSRVAGQDVYWLTATLGEAALIGGRDEEAVQWYGRATAIAGRRFGNVASTCRQARRICEYLELDWGPLNACFPLPEVVALMPAMLRRQVPPASAVQQMQDAVITALREARHERHAVLGFSCLRNWLDVVFLETVLSQGGDVAVLLEGDRPEKEEIAPQVAQSEELWRRSDQILQACCDIHYLTARTGSSTSITNQYVADILIGLANMHARQLGSVPVVMQMMDPREDSPERCVRDASTELADGLAAAVCPVVPLPLDVDLASVEPPDASAVLAKDDGAATPGSSLLHTSPRTLALLFADVKGYSRLHESELITFSREFLGKVSQLLRSAPVQPVTRQTWGDGLFFTFEQVVDAGKFALELADLIESTDWRGLGLPADLSLRIGLHAGPVYECFDPVSQQTTFCGIHVNHAARIEPITPPGDVYASEAFAALASSSAARYFVCEYVGRTPLAKGFGLFSTYHVRRVGGDEK